MEPEPRDEAGLGATWQQVLDVLQQQVTASEYTAWLADTTLLELDTEWAIVGVPNIFARETVRATYQEAIAQALRTVVGRDVAIQVEIGC